MRASCLIACLCLLAPSACGTLFRGTTQEVRIVSYPPGARGDVDGVSIQTPARLHLKRNEEHALVLRMEGYEDFHLRLEKKLFWAPFGSGPLWSSLLWLVAPAGAAWELDPDHVYVNLAPEEESLEALLARARVLLARNGEDGRDASGGTDDDSHVLLPALFRVKEAGDVFSAPDICHENLGTLYPGTSIVILEEKGNWYRLTTSRIADGWILKSVVGPR